MSEDKTTKSERCDGCRYWQEIIGKEQSGLALGECHRFPPARCPETLGFAWPNTDADSWCGEYTDMTEAASAALS